MALAKGTEGIDVNRSRVPGKVHHIRSILAELQENEAFFSIDEFGPFSIRAQGGRALVGPREIPTVPQYQKSKGSLIMTAALELSRNQITHFYSPRKDTGEMLRMLAKLKPDILLLDLRMPGKDGLAVLEETNPDSLTTRIIVLTAAEDERDAVRAMRLGARGIVLKQSASDLLVKSIHRVHGGEIWMDSRITAEVMKAFAQSSDNGPRREKPLLSDREKEIVQLLAQGYRNKEIGEKLFISEQTVKNHLHNIFDKLGVSDRLELALYAIHHRLIEHELPTSR